MTRLHAKLLMLASAIFMTALGLLTTFSPETVLRPSLVAQPIATLAIQAAGALYLGFSILNWMAKDNLIGGIYSRPVAMGNMLHFFAMAMALLKTLAHGERSVGVFLITTTYTIFAVWFGLVVFTNPLKNEPLP